MPEERALQNVTHIEQVKQPENFFRAAAREHNSWWQEQVPAGHLLYVRLAGPLSEETALGAVLSDVDARSHCLRYEGLRRVRASRTTLKQLHQVCLEDNVLVFQVGAGSRLRGIPKTHRLYTFLAHKGLLWKLYVPYTRTNCFTASAMDIITSCYTCRNDSEIQYNKNIKVKLASYLWWEIKLNNVTTKMFIDMFLVFSPHLIDKKGLWPVR